MRSYRKYIISTIIGIAVLLSTDVFNTESGKDAEKSLNLSTGTSDFHSASGTLKKNIRAY